MDSEDVDLVLVDWKATAGELQREVTRLSAIERRVVGLIERHEEAAVEAYGPGTQGFSVAIPELRNLLEPGSAPMFPGDSGHTPTCGVCMPNGDGVSSWRSKRSA